MQVVVNVLCLVAMMSLAVSGMMMSTHVFDTLNLPGSLSVARRLHLVASHWGFVLIALHLGLHWRMVIDAVRRRQHPAGREKTPMILAPLLATAAAFYISIGEDGSNYLQPDPIAGLVKRVDA